MLSVLLEENRLTEVVTMWLEERHEARLFNSSSKQQRRGFLGQNKKGKNMSPLIPTTCRPKHPILLRAPLFLTRFPDC